MRRRQRQSPLPPYYNRVYILEAARQVIAQESEAKYGIETGGVLVGFVDSGLHVVVVTAASGPGPHATHGPTTFNRDRAFCQIFLDTHARETGGIIDFVGEWHKHREPAPQPSQVDIKTYRRLAADSHCHLELPLVLIVGTEAKQDPIPVDAFVCVNAFVFRRDGFVQRPVHQLPDDAYQPLLVDSTDELA